MKRSLTMAVAFLGVASAVLFAFPDMIDFAPADVDWLLVAAWAGMLLLACARVRGVEDATLALVALFGGAFIETWGTRVGLWAYDTGETPPLFILPAWPAAALATERVAFAFAFAARPLAAMRSEHSSAPLLTERTKRFAARACLSWFLLELGLWVSSQPFHGLSAVALGLSLAVVLTARPADVSAFVGGAVVGYPLELWGTTRECWTYAIGGAPPIVSVLAHGFATVAFARAAQLVDAKLGRKSASSNEARAVHPGDPADPSLCRR